MWVDFAPVLVLAILTALLCLIVLAITFVIGPRDPRPAKALPYESGMASIGAARHRTPVQFYRTANLFILFDIEVIYLFAWGVVYRRLLAPPPDGLGLWALGSIVGFLVLLTVGLVHAWRRGMLAWTGQRGRP